MSGPWQPPPEGGGYWRAPPPRPDSPDAASHHDDSDFLLRESFGTRPEAPPPAPHDVRPPRNSRYPKFQAPLTEARQATLHQVERLLGFIEARRLMTVLNGAEVRNLGTDDHPDLLLRHRHWVGLVVRLFGVGVTFLIAVMVPGPLLALILLAAMHGALLVFRRGIATPWGYAVGGVEFVLGYLLFAYVGPPALRGALIIATLVLAALTVLAWRVDMEFITDNRLLIRTRGLLLLKRTVEAPLASVRIADVTGPFLGLGLVSVDTTSDRDLLLHNFGLIKSPNEWVTLLLNEISRPSAPASASSVD